MSAVIFLHIVLFVTVHYTFRLSVGRQPEQPPISARLVFPVISPQPTPKDIPEQEISTESEPEPTQITAKKEVAGKDITPTAEEPVNDTLPPLKTKKIDVTNITKQALEQVNAEAFNQAAKQAAKNQREKRNIIIAPVLPDITDEEKRQKAREIPLDCDSVGVSILVFLSASNRGTLTCEKTRPIDKFIQRRLPGGNDPQNDSSEKN